MDARSVQMFRDGRLVMVSMVVHWAEMNGGGVVVTRRRRADVGAVFIVYERRRRRSKETMANGHGLSLERRGRFRPWISCGQGPGQGRTRPFALQSLPALRDKSVSKKHGRFVQNSASFI